MSIMSMNPNLNYNLISSHNNAVIVARVAHWTIKGKDFYTYHELYGRVYETLASRTDVLIETLRGLDQPVGFPEFSGPILTLNNHSSEYLTPIVFEYVSQYFAQVVKTKKEIEGHPLCNGLVNLLDEITQDLTTLIYLLTSSR